MFACVFYVPRRVTTELFECVHCCYLDSVWINVSNVKISPSRNPNQSSAHHAHTDIIVIVWSLVLDSNSSKSGISRAESEDPNSLLGLLPPSPSTLLLARPSECEHCDSWPGSEMQSGVLGTRLRMPRGLAMAGQIQDAGVWRPPINAYKGDTDRQAWLPKHGGTIFSLDLDHWPCQDQVKTQTQSPVSWRVWMTESSSPPPSLA